MEKATRERLTGAVILVAVLAIVVPELLGGPDNDPSPQDAAVADAGPPLATYNLAIDSGAGEETSRQQELAASARESEAIAQSVPPPVTEQAPVPPVTDTPATPPGAASVAPEEPAARTVPAREAPATASTRPATPAPGSAGNASAGSSSGATATPSTSSAAGGGWWVQLGSFSSSDNAQRLARDLRGKGFAIDVTRVSASGKQLYRVRAGPVADRAAAVSLRQRLGTAGQAGTLVGP